MRLPDAPAIEPRGILPRGDGDGCNGRLILSFHPGSTVNDGDDPFIHVDDNSACGCGARHHLATPGYFFDLCDRCSLRHGARYDDKDLKKGK